MKILKVNSDTIKTTIDYIKKGKVIVCPTDTIYGLVCDATNKKAVKKIFKIKKRPRKKPVPIFVKNLKWAKNIAKIDKKQERFLKSAWPGKATVVLKRKGNLKIYGVEENKIALRVPKYKFINDLFKTITCPLAETSVNISNEPPILKFEEIIKHFKGKTIKPDLIINAGNLKHSKPSTVVDLTGKKPKILRK